jgi:quercetin dioxygenase-like cupin family protein
MSAALTGADVGADAAAAAVKRIASALVPRNGTRRARISKLVTTTPESAPGLRTQAVVGERAMLNLSQLERHGEIARHRHPHEQVGLVLEGSVTLVAGSETHELSAGDAYEIPGGVEHALRAGEAGARLVDTFHPVREDYRDLVTEAAS